MSARQQREGCARARAARVQTVPMHRLLSTLVALLVLSGLTISPAAQAAPPSQTEPEPQVEPETVQATRWVFLPVMTTIQTSTSRAETCGSSLQEEQLAQLLAEDPAQRRVSFRCNPLLQSVARARAEDMARRGYFSHTDPDGYGPNHYVLKAGYDLPDWYDRSKAANNVESIAAGYGTAAGALAGWKNHPPHHAHPFGTHEFYAEQTEYGIGYYYSETSAFKHYWVLITAPPTDD